MRAKPHLHNPVVTMKIQDALTKLHAQGVTEITASTVKNATSGIHRATIEHRMKVTCSLIPIRFGTQSNRRSYNIYSLQEFKTAMGC